MNKAELVTAVSERSGLSRGDATRALDAAFSTIADELSGGRDVKIVGFGSFVVIERAGGDARNPRTGEPVRVAASKAAKFRAGVQLKQAMNAGA